MKNKIFSLIVFLLCLLPPVHSQEVLKLTETSSIKLNHSSEFLNMQSTNKKQPVMFFVHGGGWNFGNKDNHDFIEELTKHGFAVIRIDYRLTQPENAFEKGTIPNPFEIQPNRFPSPLYDLDCALRWVSANAKKYKFNLDDFSLGGYSAGSHLSMMFALNGHTNSYLDQKCPYKDYKLPKIKNEVSLAGPTDFQSFVMPENQGEDYNSLSKAFVGTPEIFNNQIVEASPITYITDTNTAKESTRFLLVYTKSDNLVDLRTQFVPFYNLMKEKGYSVTAKLFNTGDHGFAERAANPSHAQEIVENIRQLLTNWPIINSANVVRKNVIQFNGINFDKNAYIDLRFSTATSKPDKHFFDLKNEQLNTSTNNINTVQLFLSDREIDFIKQREKAFFWLVNPNTPSWSNGIEINTSTLNTFKCTGSVPQNSELCNLDDQNLSSNTPFTLTSICSASVRCEYVCKAGYELIQSTKTCKENKTEINISDYYLTNPNYRWEYEKIDGFDTGLIIENPKKYSNSEFIQRFIYGGGFQDSLMDIDKDGNIYDLGDTNAGGPLTYKAIFNPKMIWMPAKLKMGEIYTTEKIKYAATSFMTGTKPETPWSEPIRTTTIKFERIVPQLSVPAGVFNDVIELIHTETYIPNNSHDFEHHLYLAKNIGIIKVTTVERYTNKKVIGGVLKNFYKTKDQYFNIELSNTSFGRPIKGSTTHSIKLSVNNGNFSNGFIDNEVIPTLILTPKGSTHIQLNNVGHWEQNVFIFNLNITTSTPLGSYMIELADSDGKKAYVAYDIIAGNIFGIMDCGGIDNYFPEAYAKHGQTKSFLSSIEDNLFSCQKATCNNGIWEVLSGEMITSPKKCDFLGVNYNP